MRHTANKILLANLKKQKCQTCTPYKLPDGRFACKVCFKTIPKDEVVIGKSHTENLGGKRG